MFRLLNQLYAFIFGYFWLPCDTCGSEFGGHEWLHTFPEVLVMKDGGTYGVCPKCHQRALKSGLQPEQWGVILLQPGQFR